MKGYFLPQISITEKEQMVAGIVQSVAELTPSTIKNLSNALNAFQKKLTATSILTIVDWIDQAAESWLHPGYPLRKEAEFFLPLVSGHSKEMVAIILSNLFKNLSRPVLMQLIEEELIDSERLDSFRPKIKGHGFSRVFGAGLITHILPGNILGLSVTSLVFGLLSKSSNLLRVSEEDVLLPVLFARTLQAVSPELSHSIAILTWKKEDAALTDAVLQESDLAIVYGNDTTIAALRHRMPPTTRAIYHGHRLSLGIIARESICDAVTEKAALDISLYDQQGCLSPHLYYVEMGSERDEDLPLLFAQRLAQALYALSSQLPKGTISPTDAAQIQQLRGTLPLRGGRVFPSPNTLDWTVFYDSDPRFSCSPLSRSIWVKPVPDLSEIPPLLHPLRKSLQAIGYALPEERQETLLPLLAEIGGSRLCPIGKMQQPPLTWHHDGQFNFLNLLRFVDWETA